MTRLFCALFLVVVSHATARGAGDAAVRFLAERVPADLGQVALVAEDAKGEAFDLPVNHLSVPQDAPARAFKIQSLAKNVPLAAVTLPEQGDDFIVLLIPSASGGYQPVVMSAKDPKFKVGDVYFHNHSDKRVLGYVGTAKFTLEPAKGTVLRPAGAKENTYYDVGFGFHDGEKGNRVLSKTRWPIDKNIRSYVFFFVNPSTKKIDFRAVDEFVAPDPEKP